MFCPICGTDCKDAPICPNCEWVLSEETADIDVLEPPIGRYEGIDGYLDVGYFDMVIHKRIHERTVEREIAYRDIVDVVFQHASSTESGYLGIRDKDALLPAVETELDAVCDDTSLIFDEKMDDAFYCAYTYLIQITHGFMPKGKKRPVLGKICCPRCKASRYTVYRRSLHRPYGRSKSLLLALLYGGLYLYALFSRKMTEYLCLECGYRWTI